MLLGSCRFLYVLVYLYTLLNRVFRETCRQKKGSSNAQVQPEGHIPGGVAQSFFRVEAFVWGFQRIIVFFFLFSGGDVDSIILVVFPVKVFFHVTMVSGKSPTISMMDSESSPPLTRNQDQIPGRISWKSLELERSSFPHNQQPSDHSLK